MNLSTFYKLSYGVYAVTTWNNGKPAGCIANSAMQITSSPSTIAVSINHDNFTNQCIRECGRFAISIMAQDSAPSIIGTLGFHSGMDMDKFAEVNYQVEEKLPVIVDSCGYLICKVIDKMETATHTIFLGEVVGAELQGDREPMTYAYYHKVVKGKSPKNAPTYIPEEEEQKASNQQRKWKCQVCGYIYEGEEMPEDYKCPLCGVGKEQFTEIEG